MDNPYRESTRSTQFVFILNAQNIPRKNSAFLPKPTTNAKEVPVALHSDMSSGEGIAWSRCVLDLSHSREQSDSIAAPNGCDGDIAAYPYFFDILAAGGGDNIIVIRGSDDY